MKLDTANFEALQWCCWRIKSWDVTRCCWVRRSWRLEGLSASSSGSGSKRERRVTRLPTLDPEPAW